MSPYPDARNVVPGDREYDFMHRLWVKNQKPGQFDWQGKEGGFIATVHERELEQPTFHIIAEAGPTLLDETAPGGPLTMGFELLMAVRGQIRYTAPSHNRRGRVVKVPLPMQRSNL